MIPFRKMNGLGNDFAVVDARVRPVALTPGRIRALAGRRAGIGFDQFILIEPARGEADATMRIMNADGGEVEACGNAARCVAALLLDETGREAVRIDSAGGIVEGRRDGPGRIAVDMGTPRFSAEAIPLAPAAGDPARLVFPEPALAAFGPATCVNVGNPHAVFFVERTADVPLDTVGPRLETHRFFPERANISFATVEAADRARVRVWERGAGATRACGTAACAVLAAGHARGLLAAAAEVVLPGGPLHVRLENGRLVMSGPYQLEWTGAITDDGFVRDRAGD
jgi:diaminopimelate epimerase